MINKFLNKASTAVLSRLPSEMAPENQYAKSFAALLCLAVAADKEFEEAEFTQASVFIEQDSFLRSQNLTVRTVEFFKMYCDEANKVMKSNTVTDFPAFQTSLIAEIRKVPDTYKDMLADLISQLTSISSGTEAATLNRINL
ncbi:MAG: hypothetical protein ACRCR2_02500 [Fusobacteriaceae bacterium]